ncbi:MAG TPA: mercury methylation corrinoid protein HgcA [Spirochaetota bacterium]|nr:mercury methylation corrinoid protein HgcA [Spirochaetota bacterium]
MKIINSVNINSCCTPANSALKPVAVCGVDRPAAIPITGEWTLRDHIGQIRSRIGAFRMEYRIDPGLYAQGNPGRNSDVFVSANYKLSFDILRRELKGMSAWILVLDTAGINVWCAAGKGSFGTAELIKRIHLHGLEKVVEHRNVIVPQLGAPGLEAHVVARSTGFHVIFGPVAARDVPAFVAAGYKASPEMRRVRFSWRDRLVLTPMEINPAMRRFPVIALGILVIFGLKPEGVLFRDAFEAGLPFVLLLLASVFSGSFITPVLLPLIPFRSFALKGLITGVLVVILVTALAGTDIWQNGALTAFTFLFFPALSSYLALQFTGASTYTGMSGVKKELKLSIPLYISAVSVSVIMLAVYKLKEWSII